TRIPRWPRICFRRNVIVAGRRDEPHGIFFTAEAGAGTTALDGRGPRPDNISISRYGDIYGPRSLVGPAQGTRRPDPRAPAGAAGGRGADRGRTLRHHPPGPAARVHPPGQAQGRRPGARPPRRGVGLLPVRPRV